MPTPGFSPTKGLTVTTGQMRVPFTIDAHRSPHQQYFPNRSFIAKQVGNVRDVGFTVGYTLPTNIPITVEGGLFNGSGLTNQKEWHKEVNYSAKAQFLFHQRAELGTEHTKHPTGRNTGAIVRHRRLL